MQYVILSIFLSLGLAGCESRSDVPNKTTGSAVGEKKKSPVTDSLPVNSSFSPSSKVPRESIVESHPWKLLIPDKKFTHIPDTEILRVSFDDLNLEHLLSMHEIPADAAKYFPEWLQQLNGQQIRIKGFMHFSTRETDLEAFILVPELHITNIGAPERVDEVIAVELKAGTTADKQGARQIDVEGIFRIDPVTSEGQLQSLYHIHEAKIILP